MEFTEKEIAVLNQMIGIALMSGKVEFDEVSEAIHKKVTQEICGRAQDEMQMGEKVWYLCDGEKPDCKKRSCYKNTNEDPCRHTRNIEYAVNFEKKKTGGRISYWETAAITEIQKTIDAMDKERVEKEEEVV